jgi:hypothetical protein
MNLLPSAEGRYYTLYSVQVAGKEYFATFGCPITDAVLTMNADGTLTAIEWCKDNATAKRECFRQIASGVKQCEMRAVRVLGPTSIYKRDM